MKKVMYAFWPFVSEIAHDFMLAAIIFAPIMMGLAFRFIIPIFEKLLCNHFGVEAIIAPYYLLLDLMLAIMTPMLFSFAGVMVILGEIDDGTTHYLVVTPLGKYGYLLSRLGIPTLLAMIYDGILLGILSNTNPTLIMSFLYVFSGGLMGIITSLFVITIAKNKLEGMALAKLSGLLMLGLPAPFFIKNPIQYILSVLPSFWLGKLGASHSTIFLVPFLITAILWIVCLYNAFKKKLV